MGCLLLAAALAGCKGRTMGDGKPDGSAVEEVVITETESATAARDSLRKRVEAVAPPRPEPRQPRNAQSSDEATSGYDSASSVLPE